MFYATVEEASHFIACQDGPKIKAWFAKKYPPNHPIALSELMDKFGFSNAMYCMRFKDEAVRFLWHFASEAILHVAPLFPISDYNLFSLVQKSVETLRLNLDDLNVCRKVAEELQREVVYGGCPKDSQQLAFAEAGYYLSCGAYTIKYKPVSAGYSMGVCPYCASATKFPLAEAKWQEETFRQRINKHQGDDD